MTDEAGVGAAARDGRPSVARWAALAREPAAPLLVAAALLAVLAGLLVLGRPDGQRALGVATLFAAGLVAAAGWSGADSLRVRRRAELALAARARRLEILSETAARLLPAAQDPDRDVLPPLFAALREAGMVDAMFSFAADDPAEPWRLRLAFHAGVPAEAAAAVARLAPGETVCGRVAGTRRAAHVAAVRGSRAPEVAFIRAQGLRAYACEPLTAGDRLLGTLAFGSRGRNRFGEEELGFFRAVARHVAIARDRARAEAALRESEGRYRALVETSPEAVFAHLDGVVAFANGPAAALFGAASPAALVGRRVLDELVAPESVPVARARTASVTVPGARTPAAELTYRRLDGTPFPVEAAAAGVLLGGRLATQVVFRDIAARKAVEAALRSRTAELEAVMATVPAAVWLVHDPEARRITGNRHAAELLRLAPGDNVSLAAPPGERPAHVRVLDVDRKEEVPPDRLPLHRAARGEVVRDEELRLAFADGAFVDALISANPLRDAAGAVIGAVGAAVDITARKLGEERQRLLARELDHRVKNMLALVQGLARQTARQAGSVDAFAETFAGRLRALSAAQDALIATGWAGAELGALVRAAIRPHAGERQVEVAVGRVMVPATLAQDLTLTLHELGTNAVRHGALSVPAGRVLIEGGLGDGGGELWLVWREEGGPPVRPPGRSGFGTRLVRQAVAHGRGGHADLDWRPEGLVCTIRVPLPPGGAR